MADSILARWEQKNPPRVEFDVATDAKGNVLQARFSVKNTTGVPIYVFKPEPPYVRIEPGGRVGFLALMPELTPYTRPIMPVVPKVVKLDRDQTLEWKVDYVLPLRDTHPYAPGALPAKPPIQKDELSKVLLFVVGYFPEADGNKLYDDATTGGQIPSYYDLKRQLLASARQVERVVPVQRMLFATQ